MNKSAVIAALIVTNVALVGVLVYQCLRAPADVFADHVQRLHLDVKGGGLIRVSLGTSSTPSGSVALNPKPAPTLVLTPRAAIQMQVELEQMIRMIRKSAGATKDQRAAPISPDQTL